MPFTAQDISDAGKIGLDFYLANSPVDQITWSVPCSRPSGQEEGRPRAPSSTSSEQLRKTYGSNFQWFNGSQVVTYNRRQTIEQANYQWRSCHDGFALDEDRLAQNGIIVIDDASKARATPATPRRSSSPR
jgi:hypothetical protein